jgi:hypothetical protein
MTDPSGPLFVTTTRPPPPGQSLPLPGTSWSMSCWDGSRPLVLVPLGVVEDHGQRLVLKAARPVRSVMRGIVKAVLIHAPNGTAYGPITVVPRAEAAANPAAFAWDGVVVAPNCSVSIGMITLEWNGES